MIEIVLIIIALFAIGALIPTGDLLPWQGDRPLDAPIYRSRHF
jgi:hypothetical protein